MRNEIEKLQLTERAKLLAKWALPESEAERRTLLVKDAIADFTNLSDVFKRMYTFGATPAAVQLGFCMTHMRPISDKMLINYIEGISTYLLNWKDKKSDVAENLNGLVEPAVEVFIDYLSSKLWSDYIIESEITGQQTQIIYGMEIPFTIEAIKLHMKRMRTKYVLPFETIDKVKASFHKHNIELYGKEGHDDKQQKITESEPKNNELKTDYLADNLTKLFDGLNESKKRIDNDRKADFIKLFQDKYLTDWKHIEWEGSNPELATLIFKLTGQSPVPLKVKRYFKTKCKYDTNNQSGKRKENAQIATIFNRTMGYNKLRKEA